MSALVAISDLAILALESNTQVLRGVSLTVDVGEVVALVGESGAGKSTLALSSLGYVKPGLSVGGGQVLFEGSPILSRGIAAPAGHRGRKATHVAQSAAAAFNPALSIGFQVGEPAVIHESAGYAEGRERARVLFEQLKLPDPSLIGRKYPHELSGGQLQRALTAMALMPSPKLVVFDEPTTALDVTTQVAFLRLVRHVIRARRMASLYVSHDLAVVAQIADRCVVMREGLIVEEAPTKQLLGAPRNFYTRELLDARDHSELREGASAKEPPDYPLLASQALTAAGLSVEYLQRTDWLGRRRIRAIDDMSMSVGRTEIMAVIGESGSGKSTLARAISGLIVPTTGEVRLDGRPLARAVAGRSKSDLRRIQIVFQSPDASLNPRATVYSILARPLRRFFQISKRELTTRIYRLLEMVGLEPIYAKRRAWQLSGGQKQRVSLARALAAEPDYLICDEVLSSLDSLIAKEVLLLIKRLQKQYGFGCLFISHDLSVVRYFADRVVVLSGGRIVEEGMVERVFASPVNTYTQQLLAAVPRLEVGWLDKTE